MSRTTVLALYPGDRHEALLELSNSWGSAPVIWEAMARHYLKITESYDHPRKGWMQLAGEDDAENEFWGLWKRNDIPIEHRAVFMFTFDCAYVIKQDYRRMAADIRKFRSDFTSTGVNHWAAIADLLDSAPDVPAIGLHCTSVSGNPFNGPWNEEKDEREPFDWSTAYDLYDQLFTWCSDESKRLAETVSTYRRSS